MTKTGGVKRATSTPVLGPQLCPICGAATHSFTRIDGFEYLRCSSCLHTFVFPVPTAAELARYYNKFYVVEPANYAIGVHERAGKLLDAIEAVRPKGRLLEVGCSWGLFLDAARTRGWDVSGVELSQVAGSSARQKLGLDVFSGRFEESPFTTEASFDAFCAWHVIEHVENPSMFLELAAKVLRPGGVVAVRTPNIVSVPARVNDVRWEWFGAPVHLSLFSPRSLSEAVERAGFEMLEVRTARGDANSPLFEIVRGFAKKLGMHARAKALMSVSSDGEVARYSRAKKLRAVNRLTDVAGFFLLPVEKLLDRFGLGAEIVLFARKPA